MLTASGQLYGKHVNHHALTVLQSATQNYLAQSVDGTEAEKPPLKIHACVKLIKNINTYKTYTYTQKKSGQISWQI